ncbi:MAG: hypothetical protein OXT09_30900 [Myxococcales bacterium]|nr:hypothetical protein [Myxococcales bacterium]
MPERALLAQLLERLVYAIERIADALDRKAGPGGQPRKPRRAVRRSPTVVPTELDRARAARVAKKLGLKSD